MRHTRPFQPLDRRQVFIAATERQQIVAAPGSLQGDIDAAGGAMLAQPQVAQFESVGTFDAATGIFGINHDFASDHGIQPSPVLVVIRGVDHGEEMLVAEAVNHQVIERNAIDIQQVSIMRIADFQALDIVGGD